MISNQEIINRFDVLYNNTMSNQAPSLDAYEMSVYFNKAQLEVLKNHLNPKGNRYGEGFDGSSKRQIDFSTLVTVEDNFTIEDNVVTVVDSDRMLTILNESAQVGEQGRTVVVVPINNVEYDTLMSRPYKYPPKSQAWRIIDGVNQFRIVTSEPVKGYSIRYVRMPKEVDLGDSNDVPEIPEALVDEVLQRAVELAKNSWEGNSQTTVELGGRSE
jgi:hypothetical protein